MLKFLNDRDGIMGITLSQMGLIIATGVLIAAVFSIIFMNDWNKKADLKNIGTGLSTIVEGMDTRFFENTTMYWFPSKDYSYLVSTSTEYIVISSKSNWNEEISFKEQFLIKPWPRIANPKWISGKDLHNYLKVKYEHTGNESDPIRSADIANVKNDLETDKETAEKSFALNPLKLNLEKPVYIEKVFIYYDKDDDGWDKIIDEKQDFVILYQV